MTSFHLIFLKLFYVIRRSETEVAVWVPIGFQIQWSEKQLHQISQRSSRRGVLFSVVYKRLLFWVSRGGAGIENKVAILSINYWRASLVPAAAVIPAPIVYANIVAVKKLVVEFLRESI